MPDYMGNALQGFAAGQTMARQNKARAAMAALTRDPSNQAALAALADADPESAMAFQQRFQDQRKAQLEDAREKLLLTGRLMEGATPQDYTQRLQAAQGMGLDTSNIPQQFDPQWLAQSQMQVRALLGRVEQELMAVAPGTAVIDKHSGKEVFKNPDRPRYYAVPPGGMLVPEPGGQPQSLTDDDIMRLEGGQSPQGSGGFPQGPF